MADIYISVAGAGAKTGVDWANAYDASSFQVALDALGLGDTLHVEEGTYTLTVTLDVDVTDGSWNQYINIIGYNSAHVNDGTQFVLDGNSAVVACLKITSINYWHVENCKIINGTSYGVEYAGGGSLRWRFVNCEFSGNGVHGVLSSYRDDNTNYIRCKFNNNSNNGYYYGEGIRFINCEIIGNGNDGLNKLMNQALVLGSIIHNNTIDGVVVTYNTYVYFSVIDDNGGKGIKCDQYNVGVLYNRITNNTSEGIAASASGNGAYEDWNGFYGNLSEVSDGSGKIYRGGNSITLTSDGYTNQATDDFSLATDGEAVGMEIPIGGIGGNNNGYYTAGLPPEYVAGGGGVACLVGGGLIA